MTKLPTSLEAANAVYRAGGEIYHLQCARQEHGDERVLNYLATDFRSTENLSASDAFIRAGQFLNDIDRTVNRGFGFKDMRKALESEDADYFPCDNMLGSALT